MSVFFLDRPSVEERMRARRKRGAFLIMTSSVWTWCGMPAEAQDAQIQKLEAEVRQIEAQHQAEIKSLQAEIRQLRKQSPAAVAATQGAGVQTPRSAAPPGFPPPQLPPKVLMTYDRGYHFGLSDATGGNTIELFGRLQLDAGGYLTYKPSAET
jgi:hypothetical protein